MANHYQGTHNVVAGTALAMGSGDNLYVAAFVNMGSSGGATGVTGTSDSTVNIFGNVLSVGGTAMSFSSIDNHVTVFAGGSIVGTGGGGLVLASNGNIVTNHGIISGFGGLFLCASGESSLVNTGIISGDDTGVEATGGFISITNSGTISCGFGPAIAIDQFSVFDEENVIINSGTIAGGLDSYSIITEDGQTTVTNSGQIFGKIQFGAADDTYDGATGSVVGLVDGRDGDDELIGGNNRDRLQGGLGSDTLEGNGGRDRFSYNGVAESSGGIHDTIVGFDARKDKFDLDVNVTGIDATVVTGVLNAGNFATDVKNAIGAAQLASHHAVLFTPTTGDLAGHVILVVDKNGTAGFQTGNKDYVFDLSDADNLGSLGVGDFI